MKIAFFNYLPLEYGGGTAKFFIDVTTGLQKRYPQLEIFIVTCNNSLAKKFLFLYSLYYMVKNNNEPIEESKEIKKKLQKVKYIQVDSFQECKKILQVFDIVYSKNDILEAFLLYLSIGKKHMKKVIFGFHTPVYYERIFSLQSILHNVLYSSPIYTFLINDVKKFHVLNTFDEKMLKNRFPRKKTLKIYNPFNFAQFSKITKVHANVIHAQKRPTQILWVGRLTKEKGIDDLLQTINKLHTMHFENAITWTIVGDGYYKNAVLQMSKKWKNVQYYGYIPAQDMPLIYKRNTLFISTSKFECFPYSFVEAQSFGLPIITYNVHGCTEIIQDNINGHIVATQEELIKKIVSVTKQNKFKKNVIKKYIRNMLHEEELFQKLYNLFTDI